MKKDKLNSWLDFFEDVVIIYFILSIFHFFIEWLKGCFDKDTRGVFIPMTVVIVGTYFLVYYLMGGK
jgi:hypothetical protein